MSLASLKYHNRGYLLPHCWGLASWEACCNLVMSLHDRMHIEWVVKPGWWHVLCHTLRCCRGHSGRSVGSPGSSLSWRPMWWHQAHLFPSPSFVVVPRLICWKLFPEFCELFPSRRLYFLYKTILSNKNVRRLEHTIQNSYSPRLISQKDLPLSNLHSGEVPRINLLWFSFSHSIVLFFLSFLFWRLHHKYEIGWQSKACSLRNLVWR